MAKVVEWLEARQNEGIKAFKVRDRFNKGYSDLFICVRGYLIVAELKAAKETAKPHQLQFIESIRKAGGIGGVCKSLGDVQKLIEEVENREPSRELN